MRKHQKDKIGETIMMAPAAGFYSTPGMGMNQVRLAYVLNKKDIQRALFLLEKALEQYNFCSTVIFRVASQSRTYDFHPFWSYRAIQDGRVELLSENIMNVVVFVPIGILMAIAFKQMTWWKALLIGCSISITIEALQFCFMKGFSEVDDVMHNTVGCLMGWLMVKGSRLMVIGFN